MIRQVKALWTLAWAFLKHVILLPLSFHGGAARWLARLREEHLAPTAKDAWQHLAGSSACINCGLCDAVCQIGGVPASQWLQSAARRAQDAPLVVEQARELRLRAQAIAKMCPARVPVESIARLIEDNAAQLTLSSSGDE